MAEQFPTGWLVGWKSIAAYLGVHEDTAQKWFKEHGLPVFEVPGGLKIGIAALFDEWLLQYNKLNRVQ